MGAKNLTATTVGPDNWSQHRPAVVDLYLDTAIGRALRHRIAIQSYVWMAVQHSQLRVYYHNKKMLGSATWACLNSADTEKFLKTGENHSWCSGDQVFVIDVINKGLNTLNMIRELRDYGQSRYGTRHYRWFRQYYDQNRSRKGSC